MIINFIEKNPAKILLFLAISPGSRYSRKEIKEKTEMNNVPLDISLNLLLSFKLINEKEKLYSPNINNLFVQNLFMEIKERFLNLPLKIQFLLIDFVSLASRLKYPQKIILFGSYSKLIFSEKSDIDIAIVFPDKIKNRNLIEKKIMSLSEKISKKYKKKIQEHFFIESDLKHKEDPLIKDILQNGIPLI